MITTRCLALVLCCCAAPASAQPSCRTLSADAALRQLAQARALGGHCGRRGDFAPAAPLRWSAALERVARQQAAWLAESGELSHRGRDGRKLGERASAAGYRWAHIAENLAQGHRDLPEVIDAWAASDGHCANLLDAGVSEAALACVASAAGEPLWVLVLGRPQAGAARSR